MSRRTMIVQAVRRNKTKQTKAVVLVIPVYATPKGQEPLVFGIPGHRAPTTEELVAAILAAGFEESVAVAAAAKIVAAREKTKPDS